MSKENEELHDEENSKEQPTKSVENSQDQSIPEENSPEPSAEERYSELNDRFLRLYAEFENFRRRSNKERLEVISSANARVFFKKTLSLRLILIYLSAMRLIFFIKIVNLEMLRISKLII